MMHLKYRFHGEWGLHVARVNNWFGRLVGYFCSNIDRKVHLKVDSRTS